MLLLEKEVCPYKYMDSCSKFKETSSPNKEGFWTSLNLENVSNSDYEHAIKVREIFNMKNIGNYNDLYVQSDTLLLLVVLESFRNTCL